MPAMQHWRAGGIAIASALAGTALVGTSSAKAEEGGGETPMIAYSFARPRPVLRDALQPKPVGIMVNGELKRDQALIVVEGQTFFIRRSDFAQVGLLVPALDDEIEIAGESYVSLSSVAGLDAQLSEEGSVLSISASPEIFPTARFNRSARLLTVGEIVPAAFISYDLTFTRWNGENAAFAYLDAGVSGAWGLLGTTVALQTQKGEVVRLDSFFQRDWPDQRLRLVIGDTSTRGTEWSAPARFFGVRFGTDFSLEPAFIAFPVPALTGAATQPSTVELLSLAGNQTLNVQPGAFAIDYQPALTGAGEVTMMITDINGLSRQVTRSFYTSPRLLQPGLADFSVEAGVIRRNFGLSSFDYGAPFAAGFFRTGLNSSLTAGARLEASPDIQMLGLGMGWVLSPIGEFGIAGALSESPSGTGTLWRAQFQRLAPTHSITVSYQRENGRFAQVGDAGNVGPFLVRPREEFALAGSVSLGAVGDIIAGHVETRTTSGERYATTTLNLNGQLGDAFYNLGLRRNRFGSRTDDGAFVSLSMPLGVRNNVNVRVDDKRSVAMISATPPTDTGVGYQFAAGYDNVTGSPIIDASTLIRTSAGEIEIAGGRTGGSQGIRLTARGALTTVAGKLVATPRLENAFALVNLDTTEDVTLFLENRPVVVKGAAGRTALLTGLQPYAENRIGIDVSSLPITADIEVSDKLVVPGFRQAVRVDFGGSVKSAASVKLVGPDGTPLAPGLEVRGGTSGQIGVTGYDGLIFLPDVKGGERLRIGNRSSQCEAYIPERADIDQNRQIGPVVCTPLTELELTP